MQNLPVRFTMKSTLSSNWTKDLHGVQHLKHASDSSIWCSVTSFGSTALLTKWFPGCRFNPKIEWHATKEDAMKSAEEWMANQ